MEIILKFSQSITTMELGLVPRLIVEQLKVTLQLDTVYSDQENFPFSVGDNILVENIIHDDGLGYNSSDYDYNFFKITDTDPNIRDFYQQLVTV